MNAKARAIHGALARVDPEAYVTDAGFRHTLDALAQMLVPMVQGLADQAIADSARREAKVREVVQQQGRPGVISALTDTGWVDHPVRLYDHPADAPELGL